MPTEQGERRAAPAPAPASKAQPPRLSYSSANHRNGVQAQPRKTAAATATAAKPGKQTGKSGHEAVSRKGRHPGHPSYPGRPLEAAAILSNPRLQQVTGLHPRRVSWWSGIRPPIDELSRLQWAMGIPDTYPVKRPKGNF
ncbi:hypothetical protein F4677DRAFT_440461 [Hypoxylon crocopeplum]|nr:hypothetical protein F4677DRAFT_440461 [Hypoxylon crocopeplum]